MIVMVGNVGRPKWEPLFARYPLGMMVSPLGWQKPWCEFYACDNDAFSHSHLSGWWEAEGETAWFKMLDRLAEYAPPMFVLLPDVVGDWKATVERSSRYLPELRRRGLPAALALQDGCDFKEAAQMETETVFIGGSTEWKVAHIEPACRFFQPRGAKVHVGRVNGRRRLQACLRCGVDSCDGTGWNRFSDLMLPRLGKTLNNWNLQLRFEEA